MLEEHPFASVSTAEEDGADQTAAAATPSPPRYEPMARIVICIDSVTNQTSQGDLNSIMRHLPTYTQPPPAAAHPSGGGRRPGLLHQRA